MRNARASHKVIGVDTIGVAACEKKKSSQRWIFAGKSKVFGNLRCMFSDCNDMLESHADRILHRRRCPLRTLNVDCWMLGLPCGPHTPQRGNKSVLPAQMHEEFGVLEDVLAALRRCRPAGGILAEVPAFLETLKDN